MDFNDITARLVRIYAAVDARFEFNIAKGTKISAIPVTLNTTQIKMTFDNNNSSPELENKVMNIIHGIASLKDNAIKTLTHSNNDAKNLISEKIRASEALKIVMDLSNADKHGYPLDNPWSSKSPRISNISSGLEISGTGSFEINILSGAVISNESAAKIAITANIIDASDRIIMSLDNLINQSLEDWKKILGELAIIT